MFNAYLVAYNDGILSSDIYPAINTIRNEKLCLNVYLLGESFQSIDLAK
jgi:hypothetical protein